MAVRRFVVPGFMPPVYGWAMGDYRPYRIWQDGERVKNPKFDAHSGYILDVKSKSPMSKPQSLAYCVDLLAKHLQETTALPKVEIVVVPSSTEGQWSPGLEHIAQALAKRDKRFVFRAKALIRTHTIEKLANGGDRSLAVHLDSLAYDWDLASTLPKILLDDVATSGNSIAGCITVIQQHLRQVVHVTPVVLGKTSHD